MTGRVNSSGVLTRPSRVRLGALVRGLATATGAVICTAMIAPLQGQSQASVQRNVLYGMYSGLALVMDVHRPSAPNGAGVVVIHGSGWHADTTWVARPLKDGHPYIDPIRAALLGAGFTVFTINHRAAPRFHYPSGIEDSRRAVQFVRHGAAGFGIDPNRIASLGHSSGGHFAALLGVEDGEGHQGSPDEIARVSWKVNAVVTIGAPFDLTLLETTEGSTPSLVIFMGVRPPFRDGKFQMEGVYAEASPITHTSTDDPPFLIIQGRADRVIRREHATRMEGALRRHSVDVTLVEIEGGHEAEFEPHVIVDWLLMRLGPT